MPTSPASASASSTFSASLAGLKAAAVAVALGLLAGCSGSAAPSDATAETSASTSQAIIGGSEDQANEAVVAIRVGNTTPFDICTGSLVAPNLVLTARHCVSKATTSTVICDETGKSANGNQVGIDYAAESIHVFTGTDPDFGKSADAEVSKVFRPTGSVLCNQDIALLVLDRSVPGIVPLPIRLHSAVHVKDRVRTVGYGKNDIGDRLGTRLRREGVGVLAVGAGVSRFDTALGPFEFEVGVSICQGDSGGPAISEDTGAIIGVVSRGGSCNDDFGHIYTQTSGFEALIREAFAAAGAVPLAEDGDVPTAAAPDAPEASAPQAGGCSVAHGTTSSTSGVGAVLGLALAGALVARRRRRA